MTEDRAQAEREWTPRPPKLRLIQTDIAANDVHQLRGIQLKELGRDPGYFLGDCLRRVEQAHLEECFDTDTLFHDVFFEPTNQHLVAVGPPLGNLQVDLQISVNGEPVELDVIEQAAERLYLVRGKVSRIEKLNDVLVKANEQKRELSVPKNNTEAGHEFTLCSVQKNNKENWIKDWIEHYRKIGVDRVILYDNNSEKLPDVDAIVIPCPYRHGLSKYLTVYGSAVWPANFLQRSLLTICGYKYQSGHLLNFDIDELLQVKSLQKFKKRKLVYFDSYFVETKLDGKLPKDYSFRHFVYRNARMRNRNYKFMVKMEALLYCHHSHRAVLKKSISTRVMLELQRIGKKVMAKIAPQSGDVFYHYKGINTGWKVDRSHLDETTEVVKFKN